MSSEREALLGSSSQQQNQHSSYSSSSQQQQQEDAFFNNNNNNTRTSSSSPKSRSVSRPTSTTNFRRTANEENSNDNDDDDAQSLHQQPSISTRNQPVDENNTINRSQKNFNSGNKIDENQENSKEPQSKISSFGQANSSILDHQQPSRQHSHSIPSFRSGSSSENNHGRNNKSSEINNNNEERTLLNRNNNNDSHDNSAELPHRRGCCCNCWNRLCAGILDYKYEITIIAALLAILIVPSYYIGKLVDEDFPGQSECWTCFNEHPDSDYVYAYNDESFPNLDHHHCVPLANVTSLDWKTASRNSDLQEYVVFRRDYCGAPACQTTDLLPGVRSVPYWLMFVSCIFGIVTSTFANIVKDCVRGCCGRKNEENKEGNNNNTSGESDQILNSHQTSSHNYGATSLTNGYVDIGLNLNNNNLPASARRSVQSGTPRLGSERNKKKKSMNHHRPVDLLAKLDRIIEHHPTETLLRLRFLLRATRSFGMIDPYYYTLLYLFTIGHFIYICVHVCTTELYSDMTSWKRYETIYAFWLNSGTIEVVCFLHSQLLVAVFVNNALKEFADDTDWAFGEHSFEIKEFELSIYAPFVAYSRPDHRHFRGKDPVTAFFLHLFPLMLIPFIFTHIIAAVIIFLPMAILLSLPLLFLWKLISAYSGEGSDAEYWRKATGSGSGSNRSSGRGASSNNGRSRSGSGIGSGRREASNQITSGIPVPANSNGMITSSSNDAQVGSFLTQQDRNNNNNNNTTTNNLNPTRNNNNHNNNIEGNTTSSLGGDDQNSDGGYDPTEFSLIHTCITTRGSPLKLYSWLFFLRLVGGFVFVCTLQAMTNYAIMFYAGGRTWADVIRMDYTHRTTKCYANAFVNKEEVYNVQLATWIFS